MKSSVISSFIFNEIIEHETYLALFKRVQKLIGNEDEESSRFQNYLYQLIFCDRAADWEDFNLSRIAWEKKHKSKVPHPLTRMGLVYINLTQPVDFDELEFEEGVLDYSVIKEPFFQIEGLLMTSEREKAKEMGLYDEDDFNYARIA